jgi:hypothetical protein
MKFSKLLLAGVAVLALGACGKKDASASAPQTEASQQAAKTNTASPLDAEFRLKGAEAIDIDALFALIPEDSRPTYDEAAFDNRLGAMVVENLRFSDNDDGEGVLVERAEFYGVDLDAIDSVASAENPSADAPFETVFEKVRFFNVQTEGFEDKDVKVSIGGIELDNLAIRQGGVDGGGAGAEGARFFNAVNFAGLYFKDISVTTQSEDAPNVDFSAPDLRFVSLGGGKLNAVIANGLEYEMNQSAATLAALRGALGPQAALILNSPLKGFLAPENQRTKLKSFEWRGIDMSGLLEWGLKSETPPMSALDLIDLGTIKMTDVESYINGRRAATMKEATVTAANFTWLVPSQIRADTKGAVYDLTAYVPETEEATLKVLRDNGLDEVKGDGRAEWNWNANSGVVELDYVADTKGLANFAMGLGFSGLKLKDIAKAKEDGEAKPVAALGKFNTFTMSLTDEKALDTIFALAALQMGGSAEDLRQSAPAMIRMSGAQVSQMNPRLPDYVNAVADFVAEGGTLEISANPPKPVAFSALQGAGASPQTLPDVINLKVTHKK